MYFKEGLKRIFLAFGYLFFILLGLIWGAESNFYASVIGGVVGFFIFKGIIYSINWIIEGFIGKHEE